MPSALPQCPATARLFAVDTEVARARPLLAAETLRIGAARDARLPIVDFAKSPGGGWSPENHAAAY